MGCTSSREARFGDDYRPPRPLSRSYSSMPFSRLYPRRHQGPGHHRQHIVSLTSSTLGTLAMDSHPEEEDDGNQSRASSTAEACAAECDDDAAVEADSMKKRLNDRNVAANGFSSLALPLPRTRVWTKVPMTPSMTPPHAQPEIINAWELFAGLDDNSPICRPNPGVVERSMSFNAITLPSAKTTPPRSSLKTQLAVPDAVAPEEAAGALKSPPPALLQSVEDSKGKPPPVPHVSLVRATVMAFQERINAARRRVRSASAATISVYVGPPGGEGKVVVYLTSLRGVRRTFEDCCHALCLLRGYGVRVDERDVSLDAGFKAELADALLAAMPIAGVMPPTGWGLPRVFANGRYVGGADEVSLLHETGKLGKVLDGCQKMRKSEAEVNLGSCEACGDIRFVPCETCSGSCKVFVEPEMNEDADNEEKVEQEQEEVDDEKMPASGDFRRCTDCNENGLIRCPVCCSNT